MTMDLLELRMVRRGALYYIKSQIVYSRDGLSMLI